MASEKITTLSYEATHGDETWNNPTLPLTWKVYRKDMKNVHEPHLSDLALHVDGHIFFVHAAVVASGERGSVYLSNAISTQRKKKPSLKRGLPISNPYIIYIDLGNTLSMRDSAQIFGIILEYIYTGKLEFEESIAINMLVASYLLRIQPLFSLCKQKIAGYFAASKEKEDVVSCIHKMLENIGDLPLTEDTASILHTVMEAIDLLKSEKPAPKPIKKKVLRRRSSYMTAMRAVHKRQIAVSARARAKPPGEGLGTNPNILDKEELQIVQNPSTKETYAEIEVTSVDKPGANKIKRVGSRRLSYTIPQTATTGDILRVHIPADIIAQPLKQDQDVERKLDTDDETRLRVSNWIYKDADGCTFGPFENGLMRAWFQEGMIPGSLMIKAAGRGNQKFQDIESFFQGRAPFE